MKLDIKKKITILVVCAQYVGMLRNLKTIDCITSDLELLAITYRYGYIIHVYKQLNFQNIYTIILAFSL